MKQNFSLSLSFFLPVQSNGLNMQICLVKKQRDSIERCSQRLRYEDKDRIDYFAKLKETSIKSHKS